MVITIDRAFFCKLFLLFAVDLPLIRQPVRDSAEGADRLAPKYRFGLPPSPRGEGWV